MGGYGCAAPYGWRSRSSGYVVYEENMGGEGPRSRSSKEPAKTKSSEPSSEGEYWWWTGLVGMEMAEVVVALVALGDLLVDVRLVTLCEVLEVLEGLVTDVLSVSPSSDEPARRSRSSRRRLSFLPVRVC